MELTALNNDTVKFCAKLKNKKFRDETGLFLLEGYKSVIEAIEYNIKLKYLFINKDKKNKYEGLLKIKDTSKNDIIETNEAVLKKISTTDTAPDIVGIAYKPKQNKEILHKSKKVILLENISDVGNLGTIIRSAVAFNIDAIVLFGQSVDIYNPKCVRSTVGNLWKINILEMSTLAELERYFSDFERVATLPKNDNTVMFNDWTPAKKTFVMFGSEAHGLSKELINYSTQGVTIEMDNQVESLNLSVSASIFMHKIGISG